MNIIVCYYGSVKGAILWRYATRRRGMFVNCGIGGPYLVARNVTISNQALVLRPALTVYSRLIITLPCSIMTEIKPDFWHGWCVPRSPTQSPLFRSSHQNIFSFSITNPRNFPSKNLALHLPLYTPCNLQCRRNFQTIAYFMVLAPF